MEQFGSHWKDFHENLYLMIFRTYVEKIKVLLKPDTDNATLHEDPFTFIKISRSALRIM